MKGELYALGRAYYTLGKLAVRMELAQDRRGNRTLEYANGLRTLQHAKEHVWLDIRSTIIIDGIANPDEVLDAAWQDEQYRERIALQFAVEGRP